MINEEKYSVSKALKWGFSILAILLVLYAIWYFRFIFACLFIALVLSLIGRPLMIFFSSVRIKKVHLSSGIAAALTLIIELFAISLAFYLLVPLIVSQANSFANIDMTNIGNYYAKPISQINNFAVKYSLLPADTNIQTYISKEITSLFNGFNLQKVVLSLLSFTSSLLMGVLITVFITFFFLKDSHIVTRFIDNITPDKYLNEVHNIITNSRRLISRYFVGVFCEIIIMILLLSLGFYIVGFNNPILIAFMCGAFVILPYIGVVVGGGIGLMILLTDFLAQNPEANILPIVLQFVVIFAIVKLVDDFLLQPFIYSKSVKAHPLEIFLVIIMAGKVGGILGMVLAIPVYTFLRIIAKEFFSKWKFIKALTKEID
ncbi:MAG: AI-2E family transporter [Bacteroidales bacterium]|nr:AI-2E family transporter [Bacteroidales bacterium]